MTGAAHGIGAAIAERLARGGFAVALLDRDERALAATTMGLREAGHHTHEQPCDVAIDDPEVCLADVAKSLGEIDVLVNNAGVIVLESALKTTRASWHQVIDVNLTATFFWAQAAAKRMSVANGGSIVNIASQLAVLGGVGRVPYAASKAGVVQLTKALAAEWASLGIRVNAVAPGPIRTRMTIERLDDPARASELIGRIPLGRPGEPEEVAEAVAFLASSEAGYITGHILHVDGGYTSA